MLVAVVRGAPGGAGGTARRRAVRDRGGGDEGGRGQGHRPGRVAATLHGQDAIVVDETITHSRVVKRHVQTAAPDSCFYVQGGLGQGIAVALGVKLAARERPVVLTIGDGAFTYNPVIPSYDASNAYELPLLIVVFNNRVYKSMNLDHRRFYPDGAAAETGEWLGTDLHRFAPICTGCPGSPTSPSRSACAPRPSTRRKRSHRRSSAPSSPSPRARPPSWTS
ncbi:thiamine pyrophosphate-dependent enzyme [Streptomyces sp. NPDC001123]